MQKNNEAYFLATTALEEFWDPSKKILFLGHWCLLYGRRDIWKDYNYEVLAPCFKKREDFIKAHKYVNSVIDRLLPILSCKLAELHHLNYQGRFWRIFLERWLCVYVSNMYDRYITIQTALNKFPNVTTVTLDESSFVVPSTFEEFDQYMGTDCYNLQIYSSILKELGLVFPSKKIDCFALLELDTTVLGGGFFLKNMLKFFRNGLDRLYNKFIKGLSCDKVVMIKTQLPVLASVQLFLFSGMKFIIFRHLTFKIKHKAKIDITKRKFISSINFANNQFEEILIKLIGRYIPRSYIEDFLEVAKLSNRYYPCNMRIIFSSIFGGCDVFGYWLASSATKGVKLAGLQHGGNYGVFAYGIDCEKHDLAVTDRYYTWGWTRSGVSTKVIPFFVNMLFTKKQMEADNGKSGILWGTTLLSRYQYVFWGMENNLTQFLEYTSWQKRFFTTMNRDIREIVTLRIRQGDNKWSALERIQEYAPDIKVEMGRWGERLWGSFLRSLSRKRLYVCDHLSTTYMEALAVNKPTILFWNQNLYGLKKDAVPYFEKLHNAGILHYSPEEAAWALNEAYNDVEKWWGCGKRQRARRDFCLHYARMPSSTLSEWKKVIHDF